MMRQINILLVDDHKVIRDGMRALLAKYTYLNIVHECEDGSQVISALKKFKVDVILMDISMKEVNGIEATRQLKKVFPNVKVIALTMHQQEGYINEMSIAGVDGFVLKSVKTKELVNAINVVMDGSFYLCLDLMNMLMAGNGVQHQLIKTILRIDNHT